MQVTAGTEGRQIYRRHIDMPNSYTLFNYDEKCIKKVDNYKVKLTIRCHSFELKSVGEIVRFSFYDERKKFNKLDWLKLKNTFHGNMLKITCVFFSFLYLHFYSFCKIIFYLMSDKFQMDSSNSIKVHLIKTKNNTFLNS